ncbi:MFS transporter [Macrococcoides canis]|nr:MFS transporter [Macrococcus canis]
MLRNTIIYLLSIFVITTGGLIYNFAISYYILELTKSPFLFSINTVIMSVGTIISLTVMGAFIDKYDRKSIIIILEILSCISLLALYLYTYNYGFNIKFLFCITAFRSLIVPVISNTFDASLTQIFDEEKIQNILGQVGTIRTSVFLLGPLLAGVLYGFVSLEMMILIFLILQIISLLLDFFLKFKPYEKSIDMIENKPEKLLEFIIGKNKEAYKYVMNSNVLSRIIILAMIINGVGAASFSVLPETIMIKELSFTPEYVGIASSVMGIGSLLATILLSKIKISNPLNSMRLAFLTLAIVMTVFTLPVYFQASLTVKLIYIAVIGMTMAFTFQFVSIPMMSYMQKSIENEYKGRVFSLLNSLGNILLPVGTLFYGFLYEFKLYILVNLFTSLVIIAVTTILLNKDTIRESNIIYGKISND